MLAEALADPLMRRWFLALIVAPITAIGIHLGAYLIEDKRRLWAGHGLCGLSCLLWAAAIALLFLSGFRWSWSWPI